MAYTLMPQDYLFGVNCYKNSASFAWLQVGHPIPRFSRSDQVLRGEVLNHKKLAP